MSRPAPHAAGVLWAGIGVGLVLGATLGAALGLLRLGIGIGLVLGAVVGWTFQTAVTQRDRP